MFIQNYLSRLRSYLIICLYIYEFQIEKEKIKFSVNKIKKFKSKNPEIKDLEDLNSQKSIRNWKGFRGKIQNS